MHQSHGTGKGIRTIIDADIRNGIKGFDMPVFYGIFS